MTNPFMPSAPQQPAANPYAQPQQPAANPYAQPQQPANPYAAPAPAGPVNPYAQQPQQPVQYTQQPQQYPAAAAPATALSARPGQFSTPPPPSASGGGGPRIRDLQGRLLIILPENITRQVPSRFLDRSGQAQMQDKLVATVIVLDGGPLVWTPKTNGQLGQQQTANVPHVIKGMWIQQSKLIEQLEEPLGMRLRGQPGIALGRLWQSGPATNDPYVLAQPSPQDVAQYDAYVSQVNPFTV